MPKNDPAQNDLQALKALIRNRVIRRGEEVPELGGRHPQWSFDFRAILLQPEALALVCRILDSALTDHYPFQIGGLETAAIPLVAGMVYASQATGRPLHGFYVRKSRKKSGLLHMVEGTLGDEPVVLIDDLINSGRSILRQIEVLAAEGKTVRAVCVIVRFRDFSYYEEMLTRKGIALISIFTLADFDLSLASERVPPLPPRSYFNVRWYGKSDAPSHFYVVPKSAPAIDGERVYFGSDGGWFFAIRQDDGSEAWRFKVGRHSKGKSIFSAPALYGGSVFFGSYDGNVYALDAETGIERWRYGEADWVGSSPALAPELGLLFIGLEFGIIRKRGGIAALDLKTGVARWEYRMPEYVHSSPLYIRELRAVVIGGNDKQVYLFDAETGALRWQTAIGGETKASFAYDHARGLLAVGSHDGKLYLLDAHAGAVRFFHQTGAAIYSTPVFYRNTIIFASLDKYLYCMDIDTQKVRWIFEAGGRIFASPIIREGHVYIGANDGRFYEINPDTGAETGFFQAAERITNAAAYDPRTHRFFVLTFANELYCLERLPHNYSSAPPASPGTMEEI